MPKEVANFLEQDRKREQAKQDQRHLNKSEFETVLSGLCTAVLHQKGQGAIMEKNKRVYCLYRVSTKGQVEKDDIPMQKQFFDFLYPEGDKSVYYRAS